MIHRAFVLLAALTLGTVPALGETKISGSFTAEDTCPALQSIKKGTNPGDIKLTPGTVYRIVGGNKEPATYYWIVVPDATPDFRWVPVTCGTSDVSTAEAAPPPDTKTQYVLAISWEPAFCEGLPDKAECKAQTSDSFEATNFALHGLWPQPRSNSYCNVSAVDRASDKAHNWTALPAVDLLADTRTRLDKWMPGTQSALERHEWITHGTCYGAEQERYFTDALTAIETIDSSPVRELFASHVGQSLTLDQIRAVFDTAFGNGAGERVRVACETDGSRRLISELTIGLTGKIGDPAGIPALILAAAPTSGGCDAGVVDPAGLQ
jgi:ribonuclease T2